jgi:hypothetical protein
VKDIINIFIDSSVLPSGERELKLSKSKSKSQAHFGSTVPGKTRP